MWCYFYCFPKVSAVRCKVMNTVPTSVIFLHAIIYSIIYIFIEKKNMRENSRTNRYCPLLKENK